MSAFASKADMLRSTFRPIRSLGKKASGRALPNQRAIVSARHPSDGFNERLPESHGVHDAARAVVLSFRCQYALRLPDVVLIPSFCRLGIAIN